MNMRIEPRDEAELAEAVATAGTPVRVEGGGTRGIGFVAADAVLSTAGLTGITLYEPGALTIVARAGTPLAEVEAALKAENQRLPFEPADWRALLGSTGASTIGGVVAANSSGSRRIQAGACRDSVIGARFVDGTGTVIKNGGRVMKNVTGYDLVKLLAGSWGTLGVLSEVSLKVLPAPEAAASMAIEVPDTAAAVKAMSAALTSPYDVAGAAYLPGRGALIRVEGLAASVAYRVDRLAALLGAHGAVSVERDRETVATAWRGLSDVAPFHAQAGDVWRVSVKPSDAPRVAERLGGRQMFDWGGGLIWALLPEGTDARAQIGAFQGHATLIRAGAQTRDRIPTFHPEPAPLAAISAGLRAKFDPRGIFNPGLMG